MLAVYYILYIGYVALAVLVTGVLIGLSWLCLWAM